MQELVSDLRGKNRVRGQSALWLGGARAHRVYFVRKKPRKNT